MVIGFKRLRVVKRDEVDYRDPGRAHARLLGAGCSHRVKEDNGRACFCTDCGASLLREPLPRRSGKTTKKRQVGEAAR